MYPFPGIGNATYLGNGTYTRQSQTQPGAPPQAAPQAASPSPPANGLLSPSGGIPYASFNSAPGSGMAQMQSIMQQFGQPSTFGGGPGMAAGGMGMANPYAQNSMTPGGQYQGGGMNSAMGGGFGANPYMNSLMGGGNPYFGGGFGQAMGNPYQNYLSGMNSSLGGGMGYGQNLGMGQYQGGMQNSMMGANQNSFMQSQQNPYAQINSMGGYSQASGAPSQGSQPLWMQYINGQGGNQ